MGKFTEGLLNEIVIMDALDLDAGQTVVDAGCGNGYMAKRFSDAVSSSGTVYAIDRDRAAIETLAAETRNTNIVAIAGDVTEPLAIKAGSVDCIYASTVVHALSRRQLDGFVAEASRLLKTNGRLAIVEIEKRNTPFGPPLAQRYSPEELIQRIPMVPEKTVTVGDHFYMQVFGRAVNPMRARSPR